jgi:hypothetical protein
MADAKVEITEPQVDDASKPVAEGGDKAVTMTEGGEKSGQPDAMPLSPEEEKVNACILKQGELVFFLMDVVLRLADSLSAQSNSTSPTSTSPTTSSCSNSPANVFPSPNLPSAQAGSLSPSSPRSSA